MNREFLRAFLVLTTVFLVAFGYLRLVHGQDKPPQLSADSRVTILKAQLKQKQIESQYLQIQQQLNLLQAQYTEATKAAQDAIDAAFKEVKLDKKEWTLNLDTLEFTKV